MCRRIPLPPLKRVCNPSRLNNPLGQSNSLARALFVPSFSFLTRSFFSEVRSIIASHPHPPTYPYAGDVAKWDVEFYLWSFRSVSVINDSIDIIASFWFRTLLMEYCVTSREWYKGTHKSEEKLVRIERSNLRITNVNYLFEVISWKWRLLYNEFNLET